MHVHSCTILKCLDAHGGCAIVIQDIVKKVKIQNQAWLVCHLYHFYLDSIPQQLLLLRIIVVLRFFF